VLAVDAVVRNVDGAALFTQAFAQVIRRLQFVFDYQDFHVPPRKPYG